MSERNEYVPGTPSWVDLQTSDPTAAKQFYASLFGWDGYDENDMGGGASYSMATRRGRHVAAIAPLPPQPGIPPHWNTYVTVSDVDAITARAGDAGGAVVMPPMDVMDAGRMSVVADPTGATIALWQAKNHIGAGIVNEHGAFTWSELLTPDVETAAAFYGTVFGWETQKFPEMGNYTVFNLGGQGIGGAPPMADANTPPHWLVYFQVDDADATVATAKQLGASVLLEPMDIPTVGRFATLADPQGAVFSVIKSESPQP
ncbi:MAG: VOC family protein [Actinomycetota bacterium]